MSFTSPSSAARLHAPRHPAWLKVLSPKPDAALRLICVPHAGGGPSAFVPWARALDRTPIEVAAAQLPGREARQSEPLPDALDAIVDGLAEAIATTDGRRFALFGHSMGAVVAFEVARRRRDRGASAPVMLFVSGAPAPCLLPIDAGLRFIGDDAAFLSAVAEKYGGVPRIVLERADLRAGMVAALRADLALTEIYRYVEAPPLECPITAYGGASDPAVTADRLAAWGAETTAAFSWRQFPGDHFYLFRGRAALLAEVTSRLQPLL